MKKLIVLLLLSSNVVQAELSDFDINWQNEKECLAINLYHEARSESMAGIVSAYVCHMFCPFWLNIYPGSKIMISTLCDIYNIIVFQ